MNYPFYKVLESSLYKLSASGPLTIINLFQIICIARNKSIVCLLTLISQKISDTPWDYVIMNKDVPPFSDELAKCLFVIVTSG